MMFLLVLVLGAAGANSEAAVIDFVLPWLSVEDATTFLPTHRRRLRDAYTHACFEEQTEGLVLE